MRNLNDDILTGDISLALNMSSVSKWIKVILAVLVVSSYLLGSSWLMEVIVISVVVSLVLPLGFFDVFIQRLLEYNTQKMEERQILNAQEANNHFEKLYKIVGK